MDLNILDTLKNNYNNQAVKLTSSGERSLNQGHPWIFSNSISKIKSSAITGDICIVFKIKN